MDEQTKEAIEMAIEAFRRTHYLLISEKILDQERLNENFTAAEALRKALAEDKQEPVAIVNYSMGGIEWLDKPLPDDTPLYTHPATWQSLSDDEKKSIQNNSWIIHDDGSKEFNTFVFARAIEQALKEKNHPCK